MQILNEKDGLRSELKNHSGPEVSYCVFINIE